MSRTEFPLPKGCAIENIEVDVKNNLLTIVYKEEKPVLKVGEWYTDGFQELYMLWLPERKHMCGFASGKWSEHITDHEDSVRFKPADMTKVEALLIGEAEKRGAHENCKVGFKGLDVRFNVAHNKFDIRENGFYYGGAELLNFTTGIWSEIIEEKKPLYVNQYKTEFFEGDTCYYIEKQKSKIKKVKNLDDDTTFTDTLLKWTEIMTKKECYQYLADRCRE